MENFIDFAHPPYLHRTTIGGYAHDYAEVGGTAEVEVAATDFGFTTMNFMGSRRYGFRVDWHRPNLSTIHFGPDYMLHVFSIPLAANRTRVMTVRRLPADVDTASYAEDAADVDHVILDEDRSIVESQSGDVLAGPDEVSVATDQPSVQFRRWYRQLVRGSRTVNSGPVRPSSRRRSRR